jgi:hypothetical protein
MTILSRDERDRKNVIAMIEEFLSLQSELVSTFREKYPGITDWNYLLDCPKNGDFQAKGERWKFQRHGSGIGFTGQTSGKVIDVCVGLPDVKIPLNSWSLCQYFESIGLEKLYFSFKWFDVSDEDGVDALIQAVKPSFSHNFTV